jgi:hypothetical protein
MKTAPKFKGKCEASDFTDDVGRFFEGNLYITKAGTWCILSGEILHPQVFQVDPSTVEQIGGDLVDDNERLKQTVETLREALDDLISFTATCSESSDFTTAIRKARKALAETESSHD